MSHKCYKAETLIIGAGVIGSSVAMHLAQQGMKEVRVIDFDLEGVLSSSELNAGGVRGTWNQPINVEMSKLTIDFFDTVKDEVGYRDCGYLWLYTPERFERAIQARERQLQMGWPVEAWDLATLTRKIPFIDKTEGLGGATFSPRDGLVNPNLLKNLFRSRARENGAVFDDRTLLRSAEYLSNGKIKLVCQQLETFPSAEEKVDVLSGRPVRSPVVTVEYIVDRVVNCAGAWAAEIARILGYSSPAFPVRRQICLFDCRDVDLTPYGMIVDSSGVYFHPEATNGLAGFANHNEPHGINYHYDGEDFFMEVIWPALYERSSAFEKLKHVTGWAGQYEVSPDESAIIGAAVNGDAGKSGRVFEAHSFSGHGVMHSHAAGLLLAELMIGGKYSTLDISALSASRFDTGKLVRETAII